MTFTEYYQHYLSLHQNKWCRRLHVVGQVATILFVTLVLYHAVAVSPLALLLLVIAPFVVYPFAWSGHFFFEHIKPAAFKNPVWAKACDWVMMYEMLRGRIPF